MVKYKKQLNKRFEKSVCILKSMEESNQGMLLSFDYLPLSALRTLGEELKNCRFCEDVEVRANSVEMIETDCLFFSEDELKEVMREVLEEIGFDLRFES